MALDPTAREANYRDSMKKYIVDNIKVTEQINLSFDKTINAPVLTSKNLRRWVVVNFGTLHRDHLSSAILDVYCCTRQDNEGFRLAQLTDIVVGYLTDNTGDGMKRITLYRSYPPPTAWDVIGGIVVQDIHESSKLLAEDETKYKLLTVLLRFASKI